MKRILFDYIYNRTYTISRIGSQLLQNTHSFFRRFAARSTMRDFVFVRLFSVWTLYVGYFAISKTICREIKQFSDIWSTICSAETLPHIFYVIVCSVSLDCVAMLACLMNRHNNANDILPVYLRHCEYFDTNEVKRFNGFDRAVPKSQIKSWNISAPVGSLVRHICLLCRLILILF